MILKTFLKSPSLTLFIVLNHWPEGSKQWLLTCSIIFGCRLIWILVIRIYVKPEKYSLVHTSGSVKHSVVLYKMIILANVCPHSQRPHLTSLHDRQLSPAPLLMIPTCFLPPILVAPPAQMSYLVISSPDMVTVLVSYAAWWSHWHTFQFTWSPGTCITGYCIGIFILYISLLCVLD